MFNKLGDSVAQIAQRTKSLAVEALEAIDAPEKTDESNLAPPTLVARRASAPPDAVRESGNFSDPDQNRLLVRLIEAVSGSCDPSILREEVSVIVTQVDLLREQAFASKSLTLEQKELASTGSLLGFLDSLLSYSGGSNDLAASALLEALEQEQEDHARTKTRLLGEIEDLKNEMEISLEEKNHEIDSLKSQLNEIQTRCDRSSESLLTTEQENRKLQVMMEKLVAEKSALELEKDDSDKIDASIIRSAFISLCLNMNEKSVRDGILRVMSEMLNLSPDEKQRCGAVLDTGGQNVLANEFLKFLEEEVDGGPQSLN